MRGIMSFKAFVVAISVLMLVVFGAAQKSWAPNPEPQVGQTIIGPALIDTEIWVLLDLSGPNPQVDVTVKGTCNEDSLEKTFSFSKPAADFGYNDAQFPDPVDWLQQADRESIIGIIEPNISPACGSSVSANTDVILVNSGSLVFGFKVTDAQIMFVE